MYIAELINQGWKFIFTDVIPHNADGFTSCIKKIVWFNDFGILFHELSHVVNDCPNWINGTGAIIDLI